jgi:plastocyanin
VVIIGGGYLVFHKSSTKTATTTPNTNSQSQGSSPGSTSNQNAPDTITFDGSQFSPATLTVKSGTMVTIKNTSSQDVQMQSNPHPTHTDDSDLNVGIVSAGQSKTFTVTNKGTFGYHNHLNPSTQGKITIE